LNAAALVTLRPVLPQWVVVVPVKELRFAKSRLAQLTQDGRAQIALAMARDVVAAAVECDLVSAVYVVTNDVLAAATLEGDGARVIADASDSGLNAALTDAARVATGWHPRNGVAALSSDLPALSAAELREALSAAEVAPRCFVPDQDGAGTTLLTAAPGSALAPQFGRASRDRHVRSSAVELSGRWPGLRCDVDTPADLDRALRQRLGRHTAAALAQLGS